MERRIFPSSQFVLNAKRSEVPAVRLSECEFLYVPCGVPSWLSLIMCGWPHVRSLKRPRKVTGILLLNYVTVFTAMPFNIFPQDCSTQVKPMETLVGCLGRSQTVAPRLHAKRLSWTGEGQAAATATPVPNQFAMSHSVVSPAPTHIAMTACVLHAGACSAARPSSEFWPFLSFPPTQIKSTACTTPVALLGS